jgi:putative transposase
MRIWKQRYHRRSNRLKGYDYSKPGFYFVTGCTKNRQNLFGEINNNVMYLNDAGKMVLRCWFEIPTHYPNVKLHEFIIMPNHIHGILEITVKQNHTNAVNPHVGVQNFEPLHGDSRHNDCLYEESQLIPNKTKPSEHRYQHIIPGSLGSIVRGFEIGVTKWFRANTDIHTVWQRNFHDSIIRSKWSVRIISRYIINNPKNWKDDEFFN